MEAEEEKALGIALRAFLGTCVSKLRDYVASWRSGVKPSLTWSSPTGMEHSGIPVRMHGIVRYSYQYWDGGGN